MGWSEKLPNGKWRAVWRDDEGHKRSRAGFTRAAEADRYAGEQESTARKGGAAYQGRTMTWATWCEQWKQLRTVEATTLDSERGRIEKWVMPRWGNVPLHKITRTAARTWVKELSEQMAPGSVHKVFRILSNSMAEAVGAEVIALNPCTGVKLPTPAPGVERYLTRAEFDSVIFHMAEPYRTAVILLVGTGMRFSEVAGLHWDRVDLEAMTIRVCETYTSAGGVKPFPKTKKERYVPLPDWVAEAIIARQPDQMPATCGLPHPRGSKCRSGLVVPALQGGALNARFVRAKHWIPALERAGVEHARQHDLRHTHASWALQGGATLSEVAEVEGHASIATTKRYAHLAKGGAADRIRAILEGNRKSERQHIVITFDHGQQLLVSEQTCGTDATAAFAAYVKADQATSADLDIEVLLVSGESIDAIRRMHSRYYPEPDQLAG